MERFVERAVVLSGVDYGEADRIVTFLTEKRGKLVAFASGARKSKRRFAGALEPFTLIRASLVERNGQTYRLDSADIEQSFHRIRLDLTAIARSMYCVELCRELTRDGQAHPELFAQLTSYLARLDAGAVGPTSLIAFELDALAHAGLMPRFGSCAICGGGLAQTGRLCFDPAHGGVLCTLCEPKVRVGAPMTPALVTALRRLQEGAREPLGAELRAGARTVLNAFISHQLGRSLKSVEFMEQTCTSKI